MALAFAGGPAPRWPLTSVGVLEETVGERIARLRERKYDAATRKSWSQKRLSAETGGVVSSAWISAAEKGRPKFPRREMLEPLAKALEVPLTYLMAPMGVMPIEEAGNWEAALMIDETLNDEERQALLRLGRCARIAKESGLAERVAG